MFLQFFCRHSTMTWLFVAPCGITVITVTVTVTVTVGTCNNKVRATTNLFGTQMCVSSRTKN